MCVTEKHLFPAYTHTHTFRRSRAEGCPFDDAVFFFFFLREAFKSDSRCGVVCPLDVAGDTAISQHQDNRSLSFAVWRYTPSVDIAVLLQRRMSRRSLSAGCCRLCRMTVDIFQLLNDTRPVGNVPQPHCTFAAALTHFLLCFYQLVIIKNRLRATGVTRIAPLIPYFHVSLA